MAETLLRRADTERWVRLLHRPHPNENNIINAGWSVKIVRFLTWEIGNRRVPPLLEGRRVIEREE